MGKIVCLIFVQCMTFSFYFVSSQEIPNRICTDNFDKEACQQIARELEYACTEDTRSMVDCFLNLDQGLPQFAIVTPEEALLAAPLVSENVVVVGEVIPAHSPYQTAVIVRAPFESGFDNLRGKRLCHPGFKHNELVTRLVLDELESTIISLNSSYCDTGDNSTILEKRIRAVASFFGSSCRPGSWIEAGELDKELKQKYPSLCDLCGTDKCDTVYQVPFNETLSCLTNNGGDVAITTLKDASLFFNSSGNSDNFQYLCSNGTVSPSSTPCTWANQLTRLIVAGSENAESVKTFINEKLSKFVYPNVLTASGIAENYVTSLAKVLQLRNTDRLNLTETTSLNSYVAARRRIPTQADSVQCNVTVKWCTLNVTEQEKCKWLQQAALNVGLQPVIECVQTEEEPNDFLSCLNDIKSEKADIAFVDVNYGYIALKKELTVVAYPETDTRQLSSILITVSANNSEIKSLNDLKGKKACLPEYGGKEWLAFVDKLRADKIAIDSCNYGNIFSNFVGGSCVPGANSNDYEIENTDSEKLCAECIPFSNTLTHAYCNADSGNKYYGTDGALRCLSAQAGDYAVITKNDVKDFAEDNQGFRGLMLIRGAFLTIITAGEVVAKNSSAKKDDIVLLLRGIEEEFGRRFNKAFKAFESFNNTLDLLFPDSTPGLAFEENTIEYVDNFKNLLRNSEKCTEVGNPSGASRIIPSSILLFVIYFALSF
ncbi:hypothetical protein NQ317_011617 [Molorchus minor]|uniref:Transferrin-like domain-containing protein n=1 Tax=Molorchus minor TaxID=1323400 RepID=A0ABQ9J2V8_9CUCU|nr:hypothetical protein NQ317_011617 [Molorchus minor]